MPQRIGCNWIARHELDDFVDQHDRYISVPLSPFCLTACPRTSPPPSSGLRPTCWLPKLLQGEDENLYPHTDFFFFTKMTFFLWYTQYYFCEINNMNLFSQFELSYYFFNVTFQIHLLVQWKKFCWWYFSDCNICIAFRTVSSLFLSTTVHTTYTQLL